VTQDELSRVRERLASAAPQGAGGEPS
jgi:hypothetical protein